MGSPVEYKVVPADLERDAERIVAVWARNLTSNTPEEHLRKFWWNYRDNPCGRGRCWLLLAGPDDQVVGTAGLGARWLSVNGVRAAAGVASDFAVDPAHRSVQPALRLQKALLGSLGDDLPLVYGVPNSKSIGVVLRLGYRVIGALGRHVKVLRLGPYLRARSGPLRALRGLAPAIDLGLRAVSAYTWRRARGRVVRELTEFDGRFDALWQRVCTSAPVLAERATQFLRWRYTDCPLRRYLILGLMSKSDDRLLGYAVCFVDSGQVTIADFLVETWDGAADDLLAGVLAWARRRGAASVAVECMGPPLGPSLKRLGFVERKTGLARSVVARPAVPAQAPETWLRDWYFTLGDEDYN